MWTDLSPVDRSAVGLLAPSWIGLMGLRTRRVLIFGLSTLMRRKLCKHQAWQNRHRSGDGRAYVRMLVAPRLQAFDHPIPMLRQSTICSRCF